MAVTQPSLVESENSPGLPTVTEEKMLQDASAACLCPIAVRAPQGRWGAEIRYKANQTPHFDHPLTAGSSLNLTQQVTV